MANILTVAKHLITAVNFTAVYLIVVKIKLISATQMQNLIIFQFQKSPAPLFNPGPPILEIHIYGYTYI